MKLKRYYVKQPLEEGALVKIDGEEYHHMKNVMRTNIGDEVILFNGDGFDAYGVVEKLDRNDGQIKVVRVLPNSSEPKIDFCLMQAVCKGEKLSLITQKITELGAKEMVVFYSEFSDIKDKTSKLDKLERVSIAAAKQCGRSSVLKIKGVVSFEEMVKEAKENFEKVFVAYENASGKSLFDSLSKNANLTKICVIIGSEGGFSPKEVEIMQQNGFEIVTLGKRILRTETAAIVSTAVTMFALER